MSGGGGATESRWGIDGGVDHWELPHGEEVGDGLARWHGAREGGNARGGARWKKGGVTRVGRLGRIGRWAD
jgi:hypothetical protein